MLMMETYTPSGGIGISVSYLAQEEEGKTLFSFLQKEKNSVDYVR
jgi:hypothetical protein